VLGSPLGWAALLGSAILAAAGHLLIRRIAAIEA